VLRELADAGVPRVAELEPEAAPVAGEPLDLLGVVACDDRDARQGPPDGSAHAVVAASPEPPFLVVGADTVFAHGDVGRFVTAFARSGAAGALAVEPRPGTVELERGRVTRILGTGLLGAPLWAVGAPVAPYVASLPGRPPHELATAFQLAIDAGEHVAGVEVAPTRGLTTPFDLLEQNFAYLGGL
jgi:hypothetical protein